ncbi:MAG: exodeoxyribonuclease VII small subunit [Coriobacteriia bacterium]|nr:exodeoxyribonuclease VII small subunit [Coriobacteriia bacterium]
MTSEAGAPGEMTFGAALGELEQIVKALESGQLELEESLERYERGVALLRACQAKLATAEQRVMMLVGELESDDAGAGAAQVSEEGVCGE